MSKICYISKKKKDKYSKDKYHKVREHCHCTCEYRGATYSICNLKYSIPKEITTTFRNASNYDYNFIITEIVEEIEQQFTCLGDNTAKYMTFSVPIEKVVRRIDKNGEEITKSMSCRLQMVVSERFLASSLSNFANNLAQEIH